MSEFSYVLTRHVHGKNIKTYALAQYCGIDRSNMYKIINGKRKPASLDMVYKISRFMQLSPAEEKELEMAYQITLTGHDNFYRRRDVLKFFEEFNLTSTSCSDAVYNTDLPGSRNEMLLNSISEVRQAVFHVISAEMADSTSSHIRLLIQPEATFLMNLICAESRNNTDVQIEHILCLNNNTDTTQSHKNYNLNCLKNVLPLYGQCRNYDCFYYYDNIQSRTGELSLFPYMIVTSRYVCLLTANFSKGCVMCSREALEMFTEIFEEYQRTATPLFRHAGNVRDQLAYVQELIQIDTKGFSFQMTPCLTPYLTASMLDKYILPDFPDRAAFCAGFAEHIKRSAPLYEHGKIISFFSLEGVKLFLQTGRTSEYPDVVCAPFDISDRIILIKKLIQSCKNQHSRMLKRCVCRLDHELFLFVNQQNGYLMFISPYTHLPVYLTIEEPGLLFTFYDFCENVNEDMFYSAEETEELLEKIIQETKQGS